SQHLTLGGWRYHFLDSQSAPQGDGGSIAPATDTAAPTAGAAQLENSEKPVILCVHGNPTWSFYWRSVFDRFASTHRIIAVDHIGCGLSDKPSQRQFAYSLSAHRDNLIRLIDELDLRRVILLAHDWGGAIGLSASIARKQRMAGIMLLNTGGFPPPYLPWR